MFKELLAVATFSLAAVGGVMIAAAPSQAQDLPNILVMGEDADRDTVPRHTQHFNQVLLAMQGELQASGYRVFDEAAASMDITDPNRVRRSLPELLAIAQRVPQPVDLVVVFQIYANAEEHPYADITDLRLRIPGRIINVNTGEAVANFQRDYQPGDLAPLPASCDRDCILAEVGARAGRVGADVANVIAQMIDDRYLASGTPVEVITSGEAVTSSGCETVPAAYTLTFRNFDDTQILRVEEYLVAFSGYDHHRPTASTATETEFWYESCTDMARLRRNLMLMAEHMDLNVDMDLRGNSVEMTNIRPPRDN
jgi:hypothetical protein